MIIRRLLLLAIAFCSLGVTQATAQTDHSASTQRKPTEATRKFVVLTGQSLVEIQQRLQPDNKAEDLIGGAGMQLRVAIQHEKNRVGAPAELHDASDDVYYVLEGAATLVLGGKLDQPREIEPGEWRSPKIIDGRIVEISKGDLVIVPRGTPHQRSTEGKDFNMILIKVFLDPIKPPATKPATEAKEQKP